MSTSKKRAYRKTSKDDATWLKEVEQKLPVWGPGTDAHRRGVVEMQSGAWELNSTLSWLPRVQVAGRDFMTRDGLVSIKPTDAFPVGDILMQNLPSDGSNWNGNFDSRLSRLKIDGRNISNGVKYGGAQMSEISRLDIENMTDYALMVPKSSRSMRLLDLNLKDSTRGLVLDDVKDIWGTNISVQRNSSWGVYIDEANGVELRGHSENCDYVLFMTGSCVSVKIHLLIQNGIDSTDTSTPIFDLGGVTDGNGVVIEGAIRKTTLPHYVAPGGVSTPFTNLSGDPSGDDWKYYKIEL